MSEKVKTPLGEETVLTPEELNIRIDERQKQDWINYKKQIDGTFKCLECGSTILSATIAHPIWDGPFAMSGGGRVFNEEVSYCPKCDEKPSFHGSPVAPEGSYHNPLIRRKK